MRYQIINALAQRARQLNEGERPLVPNEGLDAAKAAIAEMNAGKLRVVEKDSESGDEEETEEEE